MIADIDSSLSEREEDEASTASNTQTMPSNNDKVDKILLKLKQLDIIGSHIKSLQESVDQINKTVVGLQAEFSCLKQDVADAIKETNSLKTSVNFLNEVVEDGKKKLEDSQTENKKELEALRLQLLNYEVYSRRENLRFYGIPEIEGDKPTEERLYTFLEKDLNVENARSIEFQRVHRVGKSMVMQTSLEQS